MIIQRSVRMLGLVCLFALLTERVHAQMNAPAAPESNPSAEATTAPDPARAAAPVYPHANTVTPEPHSRLGGSGVEMERSWDFNEPHPEAPARESGKWYGWQTLIVDALAIGTLACTINRATGPADAAIFLLMIGAPIVHFAHGSIAAGFTSLVLRLLGGLVALIGGAEVALAEDDRSQAKVGYGLMIGGAAIALATVVLDAALFAIEPPRARARASRLKFSAWADGHTGGGMALHYRF